MTSRRSPDGDAPASTAGTACLERPRPTWITPAQLFRAAEAPAPGYPEVIPFVAGHPVSITATQPGLTHGPSAQWWGVPDPEAVFARLVRASQDAGWACASAEGRAAIQADVISLHRAGRVRTIVATRVGSLGMVTLADRAGE